MGAVVGILLPWTQASLVRGAHAAHTRATHHHMACQRVDACNIVGVGVDLGLVSWPDLYDMARYRAA